MYAASSAPANSASTSSGPALNTWVVSLVSPSSFLTRPSCTPISPAAWGTLAKKPRRSSSAVPPEAEPPPPASLEPPQAARPMARGARATRDSRRRKAGRVVVRRVDMGPQLTGARGRDDEAPSERRRGRAPGDADWARQSFAGQRLLL